MEAGQLTLEFRTKLQTYDKDKNVTFKVHSKDNR
jgi:hypothetical protein